MKGRSVPSNKWKIVVWVLMNVFIIFALPAAVAAIRWAAKVPADASSIITDFTLAAFSVLFNLGAYIVGEIPLEEPPQELAKDLQNKLAEKLVDNLIAGSGEVSENKLPSVIKEKVDKIFQRHLTTAAIRKRGETLKVRQSAKEKEYEEKVKDSNRFRAYSIWVFLCVGICGIIYGFELAIMSNLHKLIIGILIFLIATCAFCGGHTFKISQERKRHEREDT